MLKKILSGKTCAKCRMCCIFDRYDIWETPLFERETRDKVLTYAPDAKFAPVGECFMLNAGEITNDDIYRCPALTENGCILGDDKPFDCRIWPFRIMEIDDCRVIAVSTLCTEVHDRDHSELRAFLREGLAREIFAYADKYPEAVKPFYEGYTVILWENELVK